MALDHAALIRALLQALRENVFLNIFRICPLPTAPTAHCEMSWLNVSAWSNMLYIFVAEDTSQFLMGALKAFA